ncbi:MAG: Spo0E family sporulation regulatory protein-aspartic acid phosphatase [Bacillota bacterium]|nr:Spo0E family sporulation regulatory protein-aspartic acid phosphatase [Bacillota bacterium]
MKHRLESIRKDINKMIEVGIYDKGKLIKKSRELDMYIVEYIKKRLLNNDETSEK